jgi:hypothetical protein
MQEGQEKDEGGEFNEALAAHLTNHFPKEKNSCQWISREYRIGQVNRIFVKVHWI